MPQSLTVPLPIHLILLLNYEEDITCNLSVDSGLDASFLKRYFNPIQIGRVGGGGGGRGLLEPAPTLKICNFQTV